MKNKIKTKGFTIVELMFVISIIALVFVGSNQISFRSVTDSQRAEIFVNSIVSEIEQMRSSGITGKTYSGTTIVPGMWKIETNINGKGELRSYYHDGTNWILINTLSENLSTIKEVACTNINGTSINPIGATQTGTIIIEGSSYRLEGACNPVTEKILKITIGNASGDKEIYFNTVSGIIETK